MGFIKVGDAMPVLDYKDVDGQTVVCEICKKPMVVVAVNEDDKMELQCECQTLDLE